MGGYTVHSDRRQTAPHGEQDFGTPSLSTVRFDRNHPKGDIVRLLDIPESAERLGCSQKHVRNLIAAGRIKPADISLGPRSKTRISDVEIDRFITASTRSTPTSGSAA